MSVVSARLLDLEAARARLDGLIDRCLGLPSLPGRAFPNQLRTVGAMTFDDLVWDRGARVVGGLLESDDRGVTWAVLDPHPINYYNQHYGLAAVAELRASAGGVTYRHLNVAMVDNDADCPRFRADVVCVWSQAWSWVIWGERQYNIAVCLADAAIQCGSRALGLDSLLEAVDTYAEQEFRDEAKFAAFRESMVRNYS